ncbi:tetratricopeptide repeat protein [Azospirillum doebereinerae]|uniref:tetratricopeptide repeat protein n=1 Tax=Azospirillum doebereinerae TaxID=92933 RepID=UPI001EE570DD|nr:glycosyltransferase family 41 protein [Azospirillum doebereinerae]MCG5240364.1 tetratricopeptide repeat protein [Azospirillum doebereinerae]
MAAIGKALLAALEHLEAGRLSKTETLCRRILSAAPKQADAWHLAGLAAARAGRLAEARKRLATAVRHAPDRNDLRLNHVTALAASGMPSADALRLTLALEPARDDLWAALAAAAAHEEGTAATVGPWRALAGLRPADGTLRYNFGVALHEAGHLHKAVTAYREATRLSPFLEEAHFNHANALRDLGDRRAAALAYRAALAIAPASPGAARNLGLLLMPTDPRAATAAFRIAARVEPERVGGALDVATALLASGDPAGALTAFDEALARHPECSVGHNGRALALRDLGRSGDPATARALALDPGMAEAWVNRAQGWLDLGRPSDAGIGSRRALRLRSDYPAALDLLARSLHASGHPERAMMVLRRMIAVTPALPPALHSNRLLIQQSDPASDWRVLLAEHRRWNQLHAPPPGTRPLPSRREASGKLLRIGYLSADFRAHSVMAFFESLLAAHDRRVVHTVCYAAARRPDPTTVRLQALADEWRDVAGLGDEALAALIRADGIDALIDLGGHTGGNRLGVLALAPAPVRLTAIGYPGTTGLPLEGRLADPIIEPPDSRDRSSEGPVYLPDGFLRYRPPEDAPEPQPRSGQGTTVTFGSFNALGKLTRAVVEAWAGILSAVPDSRLLLKSSGLGDPAVREDLRARFIAHGVAPDRLEFLGWTANRADHLALYSRIDVGLDPFPYNGTTTTCEALWMGVPVVTLAGGRHAARVGVALLTRVGLTDLIAPTLQDYREIAASLAADAPRRAELRLELRRRMRDGPLGDAAGLARAVEAACLHLLEAAPCS